MSYHARGDRQEPKSSSNQEKGMDESSKPQSQRGKAFSVLIFMWRNLSNSSL